MKNACAFLAAVLASAPAFAQQSPPVPLDTVVVSATRDEVRVFDAPAAIGSVGTDTIRAAGPMVNLSEALDRVPGVSILNRQNYAQDLQLSIRGFGARSTFGIRGVRLIVDGIPATMPDGQGQASNVSLASAERIEVLRGPLALLYGNAAGGVVQVFTAVGAPQPTATVTGSAGSFGARRADVMFAATEGAHRATLEASHFETDGYREHSSATRDQFNGKWSWEASGSTRLDVVLNYLDQDALDPLGLTRAQWEQDPRQAPAIAFTQDARKHVRQGQAGTVIEHRFDAYTTFTARVYAGERNLDNKLSTPLAAQLPPSSSGGIVTFDRVYSGVGLQVARRIALGDSVNARILGELDYDRMRDDRQGYINNAGVQGALRRDEDDIVANGDALLQADVDFGDRWSAIAGVRSSRVRFETHDRYIAPGNPDDSGTLTYSATNPVAGVTWHASPGLNVYANAGRGFETPTFTELAYRNNASGLNTDLRASRSNHGEIGAKWRPTPDHAIDAAIFDIHTRDEIVVDTNVGGRSTFRNAGSTHRRGGEVSYAARWGEDLRSTVAITALEAKFDNGKHLPGAPERSAFAELVYAPRAAPGFESAVEVVHVGRLFVNDANDDSAPAATILSLRARYRTIVGGFELEPLLRLDNATNRRYAGSVIVNEANSRFFEAAPTRNWLVSLTARYRF
ncbi:MAG: TonB-dependent receptor family protein [Usitatibacter sp.]